MSILPSDLRGNHRKGLVELCFTHKNKYLSSLPLFAYCLTEIFWGTPGLWIRRSLLLFRVFSETFVTKGVSEVREGIGSRTTGTVERRVLGVVGYCSKRSVP